MPLIRRTAKRLLAALAVTVLMVASAQAQTSQLTLYFFDTGTPVNGMEILVDDELVAVSNSHGVAELQLEPGIHIVELRYQDAVVHQQQILAVQDEISQWIIDITGGGTAIYDEESSSPEIAAAVAAGAAVDSRLAPGIIEGRLINSDGGQPIENARIFVSGVSEDVRSEADGRFRVEVPAGTRSLSVLHSGFNTLTRDNIEVPENASTEVNLELTPTGSELPEYVVIVPHISGSLASVLEERREDVAVANILGSEQISKAGDSDAAGALKRVTGLTLVGGRFIFVRGLGERYSSTLLNGANVPSPDPTRRVVPLDLFPAGIIDSIAVQKSFTPEMPAEFGGGTVQLRTKSVPEAPFFEVEAKIKYNDQTTGKKGLDYRGGDSDWTGYDDGTRDPSDLLLEAGADGTEIREFNRFTGEGFTQEELELIGESLPVNYNVTPKDVNPGWGFSMAGGYRWDWDNDITLGFLAAMDYDDNWLTTVQQRTDYIVSGDELLPENDYTYDTTLRNVDLSGFFTLGAEIGEHNRLTYNWMLLRSTTDLTQRQQGFNKDAEGGDVQFTELEWLERQLQVNQFLGEHTIPELWDQRWDWDYTTATAETTEPDTRTYRYDPDTLTPEEDDLIFSLRNDSNQRRWGELEDNSDSWNLNLVQPLQFWDTMDLTFRGGFSHVDKDRESAVRRFAFQSKGPISGNVELRRDPNPENIIFDETIDPRGWQINEVTIATDAYTADQKIKSRYWALDFMYREWLRLGGGIRKEKSDQSVTTFDQFDPDRNPVSSELDTDDKFLSLSTTLIFGDHQVRAGYGETTNRPDFKELSEALFKDPLLDRLVKGNPNLIPAYLDNYDLRWDWYFAQGEFVSLGAFYKEFEDPIETVILAGASQITTFDNAESAKNKGLEFEMYKTLDFIGKWWDSDKWWGSEEWWSKWYINTNYAWIDSEIKLNERNSSVQTSDSRPLQGQSPYVFNFQLGYDDLDRGINAALLFNKFGKRIVDVGTNGAPDIYQQPRPVLDFVYSQKFREHWKFKFRARNLLDAEVEITQGSETRRSFYVGREYQVAIEWSY
jgi:TonB-dependent receptor